MRNTLDLPENLLTEAMQSTHSKTKTEVITRALENIIKQEKLNQQPPAKQEVWGQLPPEVFQY